MARGRRLAGITAVVLVAVAMLAGGARFQASVSTVTRDNVLEPSVVVPSELAGVAVDSRIDGWARSDRHRHAGSANRFFLGLLTGISVLTIVLLYAGSAARDRRAPLLRAWSAGHVRRRAPPLSNA